jgi:2-polyprenyl-6-methoxyphenol hydroxylase-like FAD-dependent oxidoreductase
MSKQPLSGIRVIVVGAGFAGLTTAIECVRKGHNVVVLEAVKELKPLGDIISFGSNAGRIISRWPGVQAQLDLICHHSDRFHIRLYTGETLITQIWEENGWGPKFNGHRAEIHEVFYKYALSVGVDIRMGQRVSEYFETDTEAGVISNNERVIGDVVIGADGVHSAARAMVLGFEDKPKSSGYAVWRSWFPSDQLAKNPLTKFIVENGDYHIGWLGPEVHFLAASVKNGKEFSWVCTHKVGYPECLDLLILDLLSDRMREISTKAGLSQGRRRMFSRHLKATTLLFTKLLKRLPKTDL